MIEVLRSWDDFNAGVGCPLCAPRPDQSGFHDPIRKLSVSSLYLVKEQAYRGTHDLALAEAAVHTTLQPDPINVESLGMTVPHLHWHIIPRYRSDPRWGGPIWTSERSQMASVRLSDMEQLALAEQIGRSIDDAV
jgi:hypothetical protein